MEPKLEKGGRWKLKVTTVTREGPVLASCCNRKGGSWCTAWTTEKKQNWKGHSCLKRRGGKTWARERRWLLQSTMKSERRVMEPIEAEKRKGKLKLSVQKWWLLGRRWWMGKRWNFSLRRTEAMGKEFAGEGRFLSLKWPIPHFIIKFLY